MISEAVGLPRYGSSIVEEQVVNVLSKFLRERGEKHELKKDEIAALKKNFWATNSQIAEAVGTSKSYVERVVPRKGEAEIWKVGGSVRGKVLKRDNYRCVKCGKRENSLEVHHIISKHFASKGESKDMGNLVTLCEDCHRSAPSVRKLEEFWEWVRGSQESGKN